MTNTVSIAKRFSGPTHFGNGGYCSGRFAQQLALAPGEGAEIRLLKPVPLQTPLQIEHLDGEVHIMQGETRVANAIRKQQQLVVPAPPSAAEADEAGTRFICRHYHPWPQCYVCGNQRAAGDGLCIFPGATRDGQQVAAVWQPYPALCDSSGNISTEHIWAALDCPAYYAGMINRNAKPALLGTMWASVLQPIPANQPLIIQGWPLQSSERKLMCGTAIRSIGGECLALSTSVWILLSDEQQRRFAVS